MTQTAEKFGDRKRPPARRAAVNTTFLYPKDMSANPTEYELQIGFDEDGEIIEVFVSMKKRYNSLMDQMARDVGLMLSLAIQHGCPWASIRSALHEDTFAAAIISEVDAILGEHK